MTFHLESQFSYLHPHHHHTLCLSHENLYPTADSPASPLITHHCWQRDRHSSTYTLNNNNNIINSHYTRSHPQLTHDNSSKSINVICAAFINASREIAAANPFPNSLISIIVIRDRMFSRYPCTTSSTLICKLISHTIFTEWLTEFKSTTQVHTVIIHWWMAVNPFDPILAYNLWQTRLFLRFIWKFPSLTFWIFIWEHNFCPNTTT